MSNEITTVGWIGCGRMGTAMATRLLNAGHQVAVTNRTRSKAEALGALGATVVNSPKELAHCGIVFIMVSADTDLLEVTTGADGLLSDPTDAPSIIVDCSTVSSATSATLRAACLERGTELLAAPVSGNPRVVAAGQLTMAVSGDFDAFERVTPYFGELGQGVTYVGDGEAARLVKICHNMMLGVVAQAMAEITVLAERGGVKRSAWLNFLNGSVMGSPFTTYKTPAFVNLDFKATFTPTLLGKDFELGLAAASELNVAVPVSALCTEIVHDAVKAGYGDVDFAVLLLEAARNSAMTLVPENIEVDDGLGERP